ncbi:MAG: ribosome-binding factor [Chloroflexia bacterium]|jgi:ribosome-binding factor A|nr:ribosome-binding factor [Chloroflexia bacterium]
MTRRQIQVGDEIKQIVSVLLQRELKDPRIGFVTVTGVQVTQDLKYARIHVSVMGSAEEQRATMDALTSARGFIRREIASRMEIRHVPEIQFRLDKGAEYSDQIARLLNELKESDAEKVVGDFGEDPGHLSEAEEAGTTGDGAVTGQVEESDKEPDEQPR